VRRSIGRIAVMISLAVVAACAQQAPAAKPTYTLTIHVQGVNNQGGNIGVLVFNSEKGWAENRSVALRDVIEPAHPGAVIVTIPNLPAGDYAVAVCHDVNQNHKLDRNWIGIPNEQWGMSNNPHAYIKAPPFSKARFSISGNAEIWVQMQ